VSLVVYADFNCVLCYLASWHADLLAGTPEAVDWRAVESQPHLPATGIRLDQAGSEQLEQEWSSARALFSTGSDLPGKPPARVANTGAAVAGYAEAYGAGVADHVRRLLFRAYWVDGVDIGDPEVLRRIIAVAIRRGHSTAQPLWESGYAVSMARGPITTGAYYRIRDWQDAARKLEPSSSLIVIDDQDKHTTGADAITELARATGTHIRQPSDLIEAAGALSSGRFWY